MELCDRIKRVMKIDETRKVASLSKSLRVRRAEIEDACQMGSGLDLLVGIRCGSGVGDLPKSEWLVERYE